MIENVLRITREHQLACHLPDRSYGLSTAVVTECRKHLTVSSEEGDVVLSHADTAHQSTVRWDVRRI